MIGWQLNDHMLQQLNLDYSDHSRHSAQALESKCWVHDVNIGSHSLIILYRSMANAVSGSYCHGIIDPPTKKTIWLQPKDKQC